jgi:magnesium chelatase subunit D
MSRPGTTDPRRSWPTLSARPPYPFSALVGSPELALALTLNAVSPAIGGVLVRGEKGTAKSTAVRGLAALLPDVRVVAGCRFACDPWAPDLDCPDGPHAGPGGADGAGGDVEVRPARLVELPVGASEDRVAGSLDLERALIDGRRAFEPGLLARAHRGVLYVDEVNLLGDHIVDLLLDAAAMGVNHVEREGVSVRHAARFQLVGTMNPEEGELRPQLLDRFGLAVEVRASRDPAERAEVVRRRLAYEADPQGFAVAWAGADAEVAARIRAAQGLVGEVTLGERALAAVVAACAAFDVDGLRADIVTAKTAMALAAFQGRVAVTTDDVRRAALLALPHRRRRGPFEEPGIDPGTLDAALREFDDDPDPGPGGGAPQPSAPGDVSEGETAPARQGEQTLPTGDLFTPVRLELALARGAGASAGALGRRSPARGERGHHVGDRLPSGRVRDIALAATVRAAAAAGRRGRPRREDLREKVREGREGNLVLFVVDASGSMAARRRMSVVKGAVCSLLLDAYQRRDRVGLVTFRGSGAQVPLPPTSSIEQATRRLDELPTGGRTPIAAGLERAAAILAAERVRDPRRRPLLVLLTDGRVTSGADPITAAAGLAARGVAGVVVDTEDGHVRLGLAGAIAHALSAPCLRLEELAAGGIAGVVRTLTGRAA